VSPNSKFGTNAFGSSGTLTYSVDGHSRQQPARLLRTKTASSQSRHHQYKMSWWSAVRPTSTSAGDGRPQSQMRDNGSTFIAPLTLLCNHRIYASSRCAQMSTNIQANQRVLRDEATLSFSGAYDLVRASQGLRANSESRFLHCVGFMRHRVTVLSKCPCLLHSSLRSIPSRPLVPTTSSSHN
jgi:hypothetical protein